MSPWLIGFCVFQLYPMVTTLYFSFTRYDFIQEPVWVGLRNYRFLFETDPSFWTSVRNTLWMVVFAVPLRMLFALLTAMLLTSRVRGVRLYRTLFYLPAMAPAVAAAVAFVYLLNPANGPVNRLLGAVGLPQPLWFLDPSWAKPALLVLALWGVGDAMIIFLAGLLDVPRSLYEAADLDGAGPWQRFRHVTFPMLSPVIFFSLVIGMIYMFQYFTEAYVSSSNATGGDPNNSVGDPQNSLLFYPIRLYQLGFRYTNAGSASAMAWLMFGATMLCTLILIRTSKRWVYYQGGFR